MITVHWIYRGVKHTADFACLDDAKMAFQALRAAGYVSGYTVPAGHKDNPYKSYDGDGILSDSEMTALKARMDKMVLVY